MHFFAREYSKALARTITFHDIFRRAVAGRTAQAGVAGSRGEPAGGDGRSASRGALQPDVGRRADTYGATAAECAGVRPKECGGIYRGGKSGLSLCRRRNCGFEFLLPLTLNCFERNGGGDGTRTRGLVPCRAMWPCRDRATIRCN